MNKSQSENSLETLQEIRSIMERSARFLSLSGWSGIWAGTIALIGAYIANMRLPSAWIARKNPECILCDAATVQLLWLAIIILFTALSGGIFFTWRKVKKQGLNLWNHASRKLLIQVAIPLIAGGVFCIALLGNGDNIYLSPASLIFYGLALINGSKYTISDIRYLGIFEVVLGAVNLFIPEYAIYFWASGFGVLHILYGIIMWNKYDKERD